MGISNSSYSDTSIKTRQPSPILSFSKDWDDLIAEGKIKGSFGIVKNGFSKCHLDGGSHSKPIANL